MIDVIYVGGIYYSKEEGYVQVLCMDLCGSGISVGYVSKQTWMTLDPITRQEVRAVHEPTAGLHFRPLSQCFSWRAVVELELLVKVPDCVKEYKGYYNGRRY